MRFDRLTKLIAACAAGVLVLGACTAEPDAVEEVPGTSPTPGGEISVAETSSFSSFNPQTADGNTDINNRIAYATHSGFNYVDNNLDVVPLEDFGTYERISEDPLTVKYTVNEGVAWSDGAPVGADDMMLAWAAASGRFDDELTASNGTVLSGTRYFDYAGSTEALALTGLPEIGDDNRSITLTYSQPYADWETAFGSLADDGGIGVPAHVVAQGAGLADEKELTRLIRNTPAGDALDPAPVNPELRAVADYWNTAFTTDGLPDDPALYLSSGPYIVQSIEPGTSLTLVRNDDYRWGPQPELDRITVRFLQDSSGQAAALKDGTVDIISPPADSGTLTELESMGNINLHRGNQLAYDHLDLKFDGVFADKTVREAFLHTVPRQAIVEATVQPLQPEAKPLDSEVFLTDQSAYEEAAATNGSREFAAVDPDRARDLLDGATPEVRILYNRDNTNRAAAFKLIQESASEAGFTVVDGGLPASDWAEQLGTDSHDAAIFGWTASGVGVSGVPQVFRTGSASNFNGFSSPAADALMDELVTEADAQRRDELQTRIDRLIWDARYGLPLYQVPGLQASADTIEHVEYMPNQTGLWWNFWEWSVAR
ncbi:ABC transporter family substrate-binding protein [Arthrobacter sunyaminii]|uniref:ABC transporter family substrate-binding protein n=1 Tax=Arthrobacter sunyaminii TaxID=2816859 RepID=A0A975PDT2_9MICC|nr:ABC transporter family substrate-binding protein [Arthrobacter sunyaminii]MBO0908957.1 ABC transporter family substrate-binding protein [Arthrobacter sunyaminii]QWQ35541.1 ABC transporter family substrate-binding protein [Arthrobacter sunyaminii]